MTEGLYPRLIVSSSIERRSDRMTVLVQDEAVADDDREDLEDIELDDQGYCRVTQRRLPRLARVGCAAEAVSVVDMCFKAPLLMKDSECGNRGGWQSEWRFGRLGEDNFTTLPSERDCMDVERRLRRCGVVSGDLCVNKFLEETMSVYLAVNVSSHHTFCGPCQR
jgi:hypothetical protein